MRGDEQKEFLGEREHVENAAIQIALPRKYDMGLLGPLFGPNLAALDVGRWIRFLRGSLAALP